MTTNHKELCERLRSTVIGWEGAFYAAKEAADLIESQAARIQQQALDYASLFDQCSEAQARIAEIDLERDQSVAEAQGYRDHAAKLQLELEATRQERNAAGVKARRELMPAYEARIAELEKERDALKADAERYRWLRDFGKDGVNLKPPCEHVHTLLYSHPVGVIPASRVITGDELDRAIDAALQAEKETRS